ncbi:MAG TPA: DUF1810 domain-containing protein [Acetobacteraceae bacterium]
MNDPYNLQRFVAAQADIFERVKAELQEGRKTSHWMWFIFPQLKGLGFSAIAQRYAICSRGEAEAYLGHQILGPRLRDCTDLVCCVEGRSIREIFGTPDDLKFRSSMTLFANVALDKQLFTSALDKYFHGEPDRKTLELLRQIGAGIVDGEAPRR